MAAIRLLFYSHDTFGLGHFRRSLTIAAHLRRHLPDASALIMTGLESAYAFNTPSGIDFVLGPQPAVSSFRLSVPGSEGEAVIAGTRLVFQ